MEPLVNLGLDPQTVTKLAVNFMVIRFTMLINLFKVYKVYKVYKDKAFSQELRLLACS